MKSYARFIQVIALTLVIGSIGVPGTLLIDGCGRLTQKRKLIRFAGELSRFFSSLLVKKFHWLQWNSQDTYLKFKQIFSEWPNGAIVVGNHRSHLDTFLVLASLPSVKLIAKKSLFRIPFLGGTMYALRHIAVSRRGGFSSSLNVFRAVKNRLSWGESVFFFAEGTRCSPDFRDVGLFHLTPFIAARDAGVPVIPVVFCGTERVWPKGTFKITPDSKVRVYVLDPVFPEKYDNTQQFCDDVWRRISAKYKETLSCNSDS